MIEIETYKGQTIFYDDDYDKFVCEISIEDKFSKTKRQSLKDVRKEIDAFVKKNHDFKPIKAVVVSRYGDKYDHDYSVKTIESIRSDEKFVVSEEHSRYKAHEPAAKIENHFRIFDAVIMDEVKKAENEFDVARKVKAKKISELLKKLKPVDVSQYISKQAPL